MHLFNAGRLASELRENALSETEKYRYFIILLVLRTINEALHAVAGQARNDRINFVVMTIVSLIGYHICHIINQRGRRPKVDRTPDLPFGAGQHLGFTCCRLAVITPDSIRSRCNTGTLDLISWWYFVPQRETTHFIALPRSATLRSGACGDTKQTKSKPCSLFPTLTPSAQRAPASNSNTSST